MDFVRKVKDRLQADPEPAARSYGELGEAAGENKPQRSIGIIETLTFSFLNPVLDLGYSRTIEVGDLPPPNAADSAQTVFEDLNAHWEEELLRPKPSLTRACVRTFGAAFVASNLLKLPQDILVFMGPFLLQQLVAFIDPELTPQGDATAVRGIGLLVALFIAQVAQSCFLQQYFHRVFRVAMHARSGLSAFVYVKALALSNEARQKEEFSTGAIVNMMQVDVQRINEFVPYSSNLFWSSPFQIAVCVSYLYALVGPAALAGFMAMVAIMPLNVWSLMLLRKIQERNMTRKDERVRAVSELLSGIRVLKLFAWERPASQRVLDLRAEEVLPSSPSSPREQTPPQRPAPRRHLGRARLSSRRTPRRAWQVKALFRFGVLGALQGVLWSSAPAIVALTIFAVYTSPHPPPTLLPTTHPTVRA